LHTSYLSDLLLDICFVFDGDELFGRAAVLRIVTIVDHRNGPAARRLDEFVDPFGLEQGQESVKNGLRVTEPYGIVRAAGR
jgi:hypothetical protein